MQAIDAYREFDQYSGAVSAFLKEIYDRDADDTDDLWGVMFYYAPTNREQLLKLPISAILAPFIGCRQGTTALHLAGISTLGDLACRTRADLLQIPGIGDAKVDQIEHVMARLDFTFAQTARPANTLRGAATPR